jgi:hypothetical protein
VISTEGIDQVTNITIAIEIAVIMLTASMQASRTIVLTMLYAITLFIVW